MAIKCMCNKSITIMTKRILTAIYRTIDCRCYPKAPALLADGNKTRVPVVRFTFLLIAKIVNKFAEAHFLPPKMGCDCIAPKTIRITWIANQHQNKTRNQKQSRSIVEMVCAWQRFKLQAQSIPFVFNFHFICIFVSNELRLHFLQRIGAIEVKHKHKH